MKKTKWNPKLKLMQWTKRLRKRVWKKLSRMTRPRKNVTLMAKSNKSGPNGKKSLRKRNRRRKSE